MIRWLRIVWVGLALLGGGPGPGCPRAAAVPVADEVDAAEVIRRLIARAQAVGADTNAPMAVYDNLSFHEHLASDGRVKSVKEKRYEVSIRRGMTHNRLVSVNGRQLSEEESAAQSEKERRWRETYASNRSGGRTDRMDQIINERLFARFEITTAGRERVRGHDCVVLALAPKPDKEAADERLMDRVIDLMHGRMWVDTTEYEIVAAEVETRGTMRVWGGVLGALEFMSFHVDRERGAGGIWFNRHLEVVVRGRKLFSPMSIRAREIGSGLRLVEESMTAGAQAEPGSAGAVGTSASASASASAGSVGSR